MRDLHRPAPHTARRRHAWLLWLCWLLPLANSLAVWHGYSHVRAVTVGAIAGRADDEKQPRSEARDATGCELCVVVASALAGAPPSESPALAPPGVRSEPALVWLVECAGAVTWRWYVARAPPPLLS